MERIIDFSNGVYIGQHTSNKTLLGYISALEECMVRYAKKTTVERWVCTSTFGEGYNESRVIYTLDTQSSDVLAYVNRAFLKSDNTLRPYMEYQHSFSDIPSGGTFRIEDYVNFLKTNK
jgi:hypothetical protein